MIALYHTSINTPSGVFIDSSSIALSVILLPVTIYIYIYIYVYSVLFLSPDAYAFGKYIHRH